VIAAASWHRDHGARVLLALHYLPWLAGLNLIWEIAQLPLYTLWTEGSPAYIAFAVAHCTAGDILIGACAIALALVASRAREPGDWPWLRIALIATLIGVLYTVFSEWMNTMARRSWEYSSLMPLLRVGGIELGASPLAQWLVIPPLALWLARRTWTGGQGTLRRKRAVRVRDGL
jgi:hypothetical protein